MTTTTWAHLPNAKHIDRIIASIANNPAEWKAAWEYTSYITSINVAFTEAYNATKNSDRCESWYAVTDAVKNISYSASTDAMLALIAYDLCGLLIDYSVEQLEMLHSLGTRGALLMIPMAKAFELIKAKELSLVI